jgi:tRNA(fMet)-specific endonuclease VapC
VTLSPDSNVLIDLANGHREVRRNYLSAVESGATFRLSVVVLHELRYGAAVSAKHEKQLSTLAPALTGMPRVDFDEADAEAAARVRTELRARGESIGAYDALIAGQALARRWTLVTANMREFERVRGLSVVDWTRPEEK